MKVVIFGLTVLSLLFISCTEEPKPVEEYIPVSRDLLTPLTYLKTPVKAFGFVNFLEWRNYPWMDTMITHYPSYLSDNKEKNTGVDFLNLLDSLNIHPLKDIDRIYVGLHSEDDSTLFPTLIIYGRFQPKQFNTMSQNKSFNSSDWNQLKDMGWFIKFPESGHLILTKHPESVRHAPTTNSRYFDEILINNFTLATNLNLGFIVTDDLVKMGNESKYSTNSDKKSDELNVNFSISNLKSIQSGFYLSPYLMMKNEIDFDQPIGFGTRMLLKTSVNMFSLGSFLNKQTSLSQVLDMKFRDSTIIADIKVRSEWIRPK